MKQKIKKTKEEGLSFKKLPKYEVNPFMEQFSIQITRKKLTVSKGSTIVNSETGKIEGLTEIAQIISVDRGQFIKLFTEDLVKWFNLNKSGMKVFAAVLISMQKKSIGKDIIFFDLRDEVLKKFNFSKPTFYRGLNELIEKKFLAKHISPGWFFINPAMFFNGDRARFIKEYRIREENELDTNEV